MGKKSSEAKEEKQARKRFKTEKAAAEAAAAAAASAEPEVGEEQPKRKSKKNTKAAAAAAVAAPESTEVDATEPAEALEGQEELDAAQKKQKSRKHPAVSAAHRDEDHVIDVQGNRIPIPPKHGSPISHSRPKRQSAATGLASYDNVMEIRIHTRKFQDDPNSVDGDMPTASIHLPPTATLEGLRQRIHQFCPSLPPKAQHFFRKIEGTDQFQRLDTSSRYNKSLRSVGFDLPGPHDIWVEIDLTELLQLPLETLEPQLGVAAGQEVHGGPIGAPEHQLAALQQNHLALAVANPQGNPGEQVHDPNLVGGMFDPNTGQELVLPDAAPIHHRSFNKRNRSNKRWSEEEIENLILGLMKYGTSSWTTIAKTWRFEDRTTVDLKDKWRNLVKNVRDGRQMRGMTLTEEAKSRVWRIIHENNIDPTPQNQAVHAHIPQALDQPMEQPLDQAIQHQQLQQPIETADNAPAAI